MENSTNIKVSKDTRHELRRFKAEHGDTYDQAITRLLENYGWFDE